MKDLERKCFWAGIFSKALFFLAGFNAGYIGVLVYRGNILLAIILSVGCIFSLCAGTQTFLYYQFLKTAKKRPDYDTSLYDIHKVSRIKLSFESFSSMFAANTAPWRVSNNRVMYRIIKAELDAGVYWYVETITIIYFDYPNFLKYRAWFKESTKIKQKAAKRKAEAEFTENELKLNLQFLDTVSEDVKKMKESAEAEIQKAADELKKAAQQK